MCRPDDVQSVHTENTNTIISHLPAQPTAEAFSPEKGRLSEESLLKRGFRKGINKK